MSLSKSPVLYYWACVMRLYSVHAQNCLLCKPNYAQWFVITKTGGLMLTVKYQNEKCCLLNVIKSN